ncbi:Chromatin-remodeling ATPase INO80 [Labeo rohita]|uniref:Chromatin-remodeling ATPase INO80 n=1 Tax=Labeo rohita TaxID=84645 RepID=A0ABQ8L292_LABRO|nr:Chromatin-remodeling ATPase INO80 [Labeo rohita]
MNDPAVLVLLLEQGDGSLEDHTADFVFLANMTHYPDSCLRLFYQTGLNTITRAQLSGEGPRESLTVFVEWVLVSCGSPMTVDIEDDDASPTPDRAPTADGQPSQTSHATEEVSVECKKAEEGPAHCTSTEELSVYPEPSVCPDLSSCLDFPPSLSCLIHSSLPQPHHLCLLTDPLLTLSLLSVQWVRHGSASFHRYHGWRFPRLHLQPPSPGLHCPPSAHQLHRPPRPSGSALVGHHPAIASGLHSSSCASLLHPTCSVGLHPPPSTLHPPPSTLHPPPSTSVLCRTGSAADLRLGCLSLGLCLGPPDPLCRPGSMALRLRLHLHLLPLGSSALSPPWLLPLSALPLATIMAAAWVSPGSSCSGFLSVSTLAPSSVVTTMDFVCCSPPSSARASSCTDFLIRIETNAAIHSSLFATQWAEPQPLQLTSSPHRCSRYRVGAAVRFNFCNSISSDPCYCCNPPANLTETTQKTYSLLNE